MNEIKLPVTYLGLVRSGCTDYTIMDVVDQNGATHPGVLDNPTESAWRELKSSTIDAIGPYRLIEGMPRASANVQHTTALILDIDQTDVDLVADGWAQYEPHPLLGERRYFVVSSPSNGWRKDDTTLVEDPACYSWKVIYPLAVKLSPAGLGKLQRSLVLLTAGSAVAVDRQTHDPARACFRFQALAPNFTMREFHADSPDMDIDDIRAIVEEGKSLDPMYVENIRAVNAGDQNDPTEYIVDRMRRNKGGEWWLLSGDCPMWTEDDPESKSTVAEVYAGMLLDLQAGIEADKLCGTIFGGSIKRCLINMAGGLMTISDMKVGRHYAYRPPVEASTPIHSRRLPNTGRLDHSIAAQEMLETFGDVVVVDDKGFPYVYDSDTVTWSADLKMDQLTRMTMGYSGRLTKRDKNGDWSCPFPWHRNWGTGAATTFAIELQDRPMNPWSDGLAFDDGLLSFNGDFRPRKAADHIRDIDVLPYEYAKNAECPRWMRFLDEVLGEPLGDIGPAAVEAVQMYLGACLASKATKCNVMMVLVGEGSNGKSVFLDIVKALFAPSAVACIAPSALASPADLVPLYNAKVNIVSDVGQDKWKETGVIKRIIGGESVTMKVLYKNSFAIQPTAGHWFSLNRLPSVWDDSHGWSRRSRVIPFKRLFSLEAQDRNLTSELLKELPAIALWALDGLRKAEARDYRIPELNSADEEDWEQSNRTSTLTFLDEWVQPGDKRYSAKQLYPYYQAHARRIGERPQPQRAFAMVLSRELADTPMKTRVRKGTNYVYVYQIAELTMSHVDGSLDI